MGARLPEKLQRPRACSDLVPRERDTGTETPTPNPTPTTRQPANVRPTSTALKAPSAWSAGVTARVGTHALCLTPSTDAGRATSPGAAGDGRDRAPAAETVRALELHGGQRLLLPRHLPRN